MRAYTPWALEIGVPPGLFAHLPRAYRQACHPGLFGRLPPPKQPKITFSPASIIRSRQTYLIDNHLIINNIRKILGAKRAEDFP